MVLKRTIKCPTCIGNGFCTEGETCGTCQGTGEIHSDDSVSDTPCQPNIPSETA